MSGERREKSEEAALIGKRFLFSSTNVTDFKDSLSEVNLMKIYGIKGKKLLLFIFSSLEDVSKQPNNQSVYTKLYYDKMYGIKYFYKPHTI